MPLHTLEKPMNRFLDVGGGFRCHATEVLLHFIEFVFEYGFHEGRLPRKAGIERLLAHPQLGSKIVHADPSEAVKEKLPPRDGDHLPYNDRSRHRLVLSGEVHRHENTVETSAVLQVSSRRCQPSVGCPTRSL